jgi:hypothetical protein
VADYTLKINEICDSLASIDVNINENEKVQICLGGLVSKFGAFRTAVCTVMTTYLLAYEVLNPQPLRTDIKPLTNMIRY